MFERLNVLKGLLMFSFLSMGFSFARDGRGVLWWIWLIIIVLIILFLIWVMFKPSHEEKPEVKEEPSAKKELKERTEGVIGKEEDKEDDLKLIEGIGPKVSQILKEHGIKTFKALSEKDPEDIKKLLESKGIRGIVDPTTWPEQAKLASEGKWDELKELQSKLKGGRRV